MNAVERTNPYVALAEHTKALFVALETQRAELYEKLAELDVHRKEIQAHIAEVKKQCSNVADAYKALTTEQLVIANQDETNFPEGRYYTGPDEEEVTSHHGLR